MAQAPETRKLADLLAVLLADTFNLYQKTHGYHWNIRGDDFPQLHKFLNKQYDELWGAVDPIAEEIRALDFLAPQEFSKLGSIKPGDPSKSSTAMLKDLLAGHNSLIESAQAVADQAGVVDDQGVLNLAADRLQAHKKARWMLTATLDKSTPQEAEA